MLALIAALFLVSSSAHADSRNAPGYRVLFDLQASGSAEIVDGYGAYLQLHVSGSRSTFRYCDNFEGKGLDGAPNPTRNRAKFVPLGASDTGAYRCHDYSPSEVAAGREIIGIGGKAMFVLRSSGWSTANGGDLLFIFAKKIPLLGSPTYRTLRLRVIRKSSAELAFTVESVVPRAGVYPTDLLSFGLTTSGLGFPNGINRLVLNSQSPNPVRIDIDQLER